MVSGLVSNLTAVALLGHAVLGCCWHHRHLCRLEAARPAVVDCPRAACHCHPCEHRHCRGDQPADEEHGSSHDCDGGRCVFVTAQPVRSETAPMTQFREAITAAATGNAGLPVELNLFSKAFAATGRCPPLPTYLLHQVLFVSWNCTYVEADLSDLE